MKHIILLCTLTAILSPLAATPVYAVAESAEEAIPAYQYVSQEVQSPSIVSSVYKYRLPNPEITQQVQVLDVDTNTFVQRVIVSEPVTTRELATVQTSLTGVETALNDLVPTTTVDFKLPTKGIGTVDITYEYQSGKQFTASRFFLKRAPHVILPKTIAVYAVNDEGVEEVVLAPSSVRQSLYISFPQTTSSKWRVQLTYDQPLRLEEAAFVLDNVQKEVERHVAFLMNPEHRYRVYSNPDRPVSIAILAIAQLENGADADIASEALMFQKNETYVPSDTDGDGVPDNIDNCVDISNSDQIDLDYNQKGDACDDFDRDRIINSVDNCPDVPNYNQSDEDADGIGDICDTEDSRMTEQYSWIPWVGLGFAILVILGMFMIVLRRDPNVHETDDVPEL